MQTKPFHRMPRSSSRLSTRWLNDGLSIGSTREAERSSGTLT
ncbi:hypothetical protein PCL1606_47770 [Pseudomonas chlororaphis]|uniref:Uncharacterized protein n=1 Tax=Pseudomonas chlororaphis TaxID=587753 RepID=A0A0D5Y4H9_9PSED|nr:hypothetical protein PCL1606_47770 [Pseudomonas chlororaphis]